MNENKELDYIANDFSEFVFFQVRAEKMKPDEEYHFVQTNIRLLFSMYIKESYIKKNDKMLPYSMYKKIDFKSLADFIVADNAFMLPLFED